MSKDGWHKRGACRGTDPDLFFSCATDDVEMARRVCSGCPVTAECLASAMAEEVVGKSPEQNLKLRSGVRGGMTPMERWEMAYPGLAQAYRAKRNARLRTARAKAREEAPALAGAAA
ncbi:MAG: hypothetical protein JWM19_895 [Actinomycetia bacterium]|nr:hypothetical protein [Actinomycetes bacterium]